MLTGDGESDDTICVSGAQASAVLSLPPEILAEIFLRMQFEQKNASAVRESMPGLARDRVVYTVPVE